MAFENQVDLDHPVHDVRSAAMKVFENQGFPTKKMEAWKYTSLKSLEKLEYFIKSIGDVVLVYLLLLFLLVVF